MHFNISTIYSRDELDLNPGNSIGMSLGYILTVRRFVYVGLSVGLLVCSFVCMSFILSDGLTEGPTPTD